MPSTDDRTIFRSSILFLLGVASLGFVGACASAPTSESSISGLRPKVMAELLACELQLARKSFGDDVVVEGEVEFPVTFGTRESGELAAVAAANAGGASPAKMTIRLAGPLACPDTFTARKIGQLRDPYTLDEDDPDGQMPVIDVEPFAE